jgi:hypothetical protein
MSKTEATLCFLCYKVDGYKVVAALSFGGNHMLVQVKRMVKNLKTEYKN